MDCVFVGGSIRIRALPVAVKDRIDSIIDKGFRILVGDAMGVDAAVQAYLASKQYPNVEVFCVNAPRNAIGNWNIRVVAAIERRALDRSDYILKDEAMAKEARYGFMIWDGKSSGTLNNVLNLISEGKQCLVYKKWLEDFETINAIQDLERLISLTDSDEIGKIDKKLHLFERIAELRQGWLPHLNG